MKSHLGHQKVLASLPLRHDLRKWYPDMTEDELKSVLVANFVTVHGYKLNFFPKGAGKEWLLDQLEALVWYRKLDEELQEAAVKSEAEQQNKIRRKRTTAKTPKQETSSPFGDES